MLHDIGIGQCDAPGIHCHGTHLYIEHGYLGAELLRAEGLPRHALVCERHTGMGLSREMIEERGWPLPCRDMRPVTLEEKLVCYADKFFLQVAPRRDVHARGGAAEGGALRRGRGQAVRRAARTLRRVREEVGTGTGHTIEAGGREKYFPCKAWRKHVFRYLLIR